MSNKKILAICATIALAITVFIAVIINVSEPRLAGAVLPNCNQTTCLTNLAVLGPVYSSQDMTEGGINSTTTPANMTLQASDFASVSLLSDIPTVGNITLTLPASSTLTTFLTNAGDSSSFAITNATTSAFTITIAGGTGSLLQKASTTATILSGGSATFDVFRKANSDLVFILNPSI